MLGAEAKLMIEAGGLRSIGQDSEGVIQYSGIESLAELEALYLIKLKQGLTLIVPKACQPEAELRVFMERLAEQSGLPLEDHSDRPWAEAING